MAKVLVVDEERLLCDLLAEVLIRAGHRVFSAYSGEEALALFEQKRPEVTILDLALSDMNALTVLRELRKLDPTAPVIALTGAPDPVLENQVRELGVADFLRKNLDLQIALRSVEKTIKAAATPTGESEGPARILVVDDEPAICELLHEFLTREGYRVSTAADGEEALEAVKQTEPHLMLLDLRMPKMDGLTVLRRLAKQAPEVGVIVLSAVQDAAIVQETMELGSFDYFPKPLNLERLAISVRAKLFFMEAKPHPWWRRALGLE